MAGLWEDGRGEMVCAMTVDEALKMGMTLSDARKVAFATAKTLEGALEVAWKCMPEILKLKKVISIPFAHCIRIRNGMNV